jgi:hypothetical protein
MEIGGPVDDAMKPYSTSSLSLEREPYVKTISVPAAYLSSAITRASQQLGAFLPSLFGGILVAQGLVDGCVRAMRE